LEPGIGEREGTIMKKTNRDVNMPIGKLTKVKDMLPPPEELMVSEKTVKVTLRLSETSIKFFKQYAQKYHTKYQRVIRRLVDVYAERFA
jgi:predicted DNA binding CopG/RHH family protein